MTVAPLSVASWPLAARLADAEIMSNGWHVLVVAAGRETEVAAEVAEQLAGLVDRPVARHLVSTSRDLEDAVQRDPGALLIVSGFAVFDDDAWRVVDMARSRLERDGQTLLVMAEDDAAKVPTLAPNLWSWIGDGVWSYAVEAGLDAAERAGRLDTLRAQYGFDDVELLRRAHAGELARDADIAEWLILLGRAELLPGTETSR